MKLVSITMSSLRPQWDGSRLFFNVSDGATQVPCAISRTALEEICEARCFKAADLLACFGEARERIEGLALEKLRGRAPGISGRVNLWADDVNYLPPSDSAAAYRSASRAQLP
jgi:hypothetical protein